MIKKNSSEGLPFEIQLKLDPFFEDLQQSGIHYIGHGIISDSGDHTGYFSDKNWGNIYINNAYFFQEPILNDFEEGKLDLVSWKKSEDTRSVSHIRKELTSIASGMTIQKNCGNYNTFFNLGFREDIDLAQFAFLKKDLLLAYFEIFNDYHLLWRKQKRKSWSPFLIS